MMFFGLNNLSFGQRHTRGSTIKNTPHLGLFLLSMARKISKYVAGDRFWTLLGYFGYLCILKHVWDKLTHPCLITSFQTLPEIGLIGVEFSLQKILIYAFKLISFFDGYLFIERIFPCSNMVLKKTWSGLLFTKNLKTKFIA